MRNRLSLEKIAHCFIMFSERKSWSVLDGRSIEGKKHKILAE
jgi:hypothetical protein